MPFWFIRSIQLWINLSIVLFLGTAVHAQEGSDGNQHGLDAPSFLKHQKTPSQADSVLPPVRLQPLEDQQKLPLPSVCIQQIKLDGNTIFNKELKALVKLYKDKGCSVTSEDLENLRLEMTKLYIDNGYISSGAIIPDQTVQANDAVITFKIIEGGIPKVVMKDKGFFQEDYIKERLLLGVKTPFRINTLQERLFFLQQDNRIVRLDAELSPGISPGSSELHINIKERYPISAELEFDNHQAPTIGAERGLITVAHQNVTKRGDILNLTLGRSSGLDMQIDTSYTLPVSPQDTTVNIRYRRNNSLVIEEPFDPLDVKSRSQNYTVGFRHPFHRALQQEPTFSQRELALSLSAEHLRSETFLLGEPFSFSAGSEDGESKVTALRFMIEWLQITQRQVIAARSRFSLGVDVFGATTNDVQDNPITSDRDESEIPTARFFSWLGQLQWRKQFQPRNVQIFFRLDTQLTTEPLLALEQIAVGGRFSVRGYRENQLVRDNGLVASLETRAPLILLLENKWMNSLESMVQPIQSLPFIRNKSWAHSILLVPFIDFGTGWNRKVDTPDPRTLASVGLGLRWAKSWGMKVPLQTQFEMFRGHQLKDVDTVGNDLQDKGYHLQFSIVTAY